MRILDLEALERAEACSVADEEGVWDALTLLMPHLDDHLAHVEHARAFEGGVCNLTACRARDAEQTPLYILVSSDGQVRVGRTDDLRRSTSRYLDSFDPLWHGVISVTASAFHRPLGDRLDLWIVVRPGSAEQAEAPPVAYHGLVWVDDEGDPRLEPSLDDQGGQDRRRWLPDSAEGLPELLTCCNFACPVGTDALDGRAKESKALIDEVESKRLDQIEAVTWASQEPDKGEVLGVAQGREVSFYVNGALQGRELGERVSALALVGDPSLPVRAIVASDARLLIALEEQLGNIKEEWKQSLHDFPVGVAFLPLEVGQRPAGWPDVLVAFHDGSLQRLRFVGKARIRGAWTRAWRELGHEEVLARIKLALDCREKGNREHLQAALLGAVDGMLEGAPSADPESRESWRRAALGLFHPDVSFRILSHPLDLLLDTFERWLAEDRGEWVFAAELLSQIYTGRFYLAVRARIDEAFRSLAFTSTQRAHAAVEGLLDRSEITRDSYWNREEPTNQQDTIDRSVLGVERWANTYLFTSAARPDASSADASPSGLVGFDLPEEHLVVSGARWLKTYRIAGHGTLDLLGRGHDVLEKEGIRSVVAVPGAQGSRLLICGAAGHLYLFAVNMENGELVERHHLSRQGAEPGLRESAWAAAGTMLDGGPILAVAYNERRKSRIRLLSVAKDRLQHLSWVSLDIPRVRALDIAVDGSGGLLLAAGSYHAGPLRLLTLGKDGRERSPRKWFRVLKSGTLSVRFSSSVNPSWLFAGGRNGFFWCADLKQRSDIEDLAWTYHLGAAIRAIEAVDVQGESHALAGAENGRLVLLRARDGRRIWKHNMGHSVRRISALGASGSRVIVGMAGQRIAALSLVEDQAEALQRVEAWIPQLEDGQQAETEALRFAAESVGALFQLIQKKEPLASLLSRFVQREIRARMVRYLAREIGPGGFQEEIKPILRALTLRELVLLLSYLPETAHAWDDAIWDELNHRPISTGDEGVKAGVAAVVVFVQRLQKGELERFLREANIREEYLKYSWLRLELARMLLKQVGRAQPEERKKPADLLAATLPWLFRHPPAMVRSCADAVRYGAAARAPFERFADITQALKREGIPTLKDVEILAAELREVARKDPMLTMLANLASLFAFARAERSRTWSEWRREAMASLRGLERSLGALARSRPLLSDLVKPLRKWLSEPIPEDQEPASQRSAWLRGARRHLDEPLPEAKPNESTSLWQPIVRHLVRETRAVLSLIIRLETEYVFLLVRPYLRLEALELREGNKAELRLRMEPEGHRTLDDVTIVVDASVEGGLHGAGTSQLEVWVAHFTEKSFGKTLNLSGYLNEGQETISVETRLQDGPGYKLAEGWSFQVPRSPARRAVQLSLDSHLPGVFHAYLQDVVQTRASVVLAVIDPDLGRGVFVTEWLKSTGGEQVPLDDLLRDIGPGRRYSALNLTMEMLERCVQGLDPQEGGPWSLLETADTDAPPRPRLLFPADETLARLLEEEVAGLLEKWMEFLARRLAGAQPQLVLLLTPVHAARIRHLLTGAVVEKAVHRAALEEHGEICRSELLSFLQREAGLEEERARERLESMGWDLRLALSWLRWIKEDAKRKNQATARFLEETRAHGDLRLELGSLTPMLLIQALVGADAVTTLPLREAEPGHVAADDYYSTTKVNVPKLLQRHGEFFTERSLQSLQADQGRVGQVEVQGFGFRGTTKAFRTHLLALARHPTRKEREQSFETLSRFGIGSQVADIFRTRSPYRELILDLYDKAAARSAPNLDAAVYGGLKGQERSPLESLSLTEISAVPVKQLAALFPADREEDHLRRLQAIGRFWQPGHEENVLPTLVRLFSPQPVSRIDPRAERWDEPLARLRWPLFGIGIVNEGAREGYPTEYLFWTAAESPIQPGDLSAIGEAVDRAVRRRASEKEGDGTWPYPRIMVCGPGAEAAGLDPTRRVAVLNATDLVHAAWTEGFPNGLLRRARAHLRITALSPFQTSGALPAGSPLFVGREQELDFIKAKIRTASILIIGSRRVGKTSLLNQANRWAQGEPYLEPLFIDLQGCLTREDFQRRFKRAAAARGMAGKSQNLQETAEEIRKQGKICLFLLNEIDGLLQQDPELVASWRGLNDQQIARFLMVGYTAIGDIGKPVSPFFHFTEGLSFGGKAIVLDVLSEPAAAKLLDLLESSDVQARWASARDREQAYKLCLDRSYRIPWVLQRYGQLLVEHLERERKDILTFHDVEEVIEAQGGVVWKYIDGIDYQTLGFRGKVNAGRPGFQLVLYAVARQKYFLGGRQAGVIDARIKGRSPLAADLGFTIGEAKEIVKETMSILLRGQEKKAMEAWFESVDLEAAFRLLTLTMMLEPDPGDDRRYGFLLHLLPSELYRQYGQKDPTLDGLIAHKAVEFMQSIRTKERID